MFEYLIEDFKTYKPLLSAIKHEYEMMLVHQREKIRELEPLKVFAKRNLNTQKLILCEVLQRKGYQACVFVVLNLLYFLEHACDSF